MKIYGHGVCCRDARDGRAKADRNQNINDEDLVNRFKFNISDDGEGMAMGNSHQITIILQRNCSFGQVILTWASSLLNSIPPSHPCDLFCPLFTAE